MASRLGQGFVEFLLKKDKFMAGSKAMMRMLQSMQNRLRAAAGLARIKAANNARTLSPN